MSEIDILMQRYGTPLYIYQLDAINRRAPTSKRCCLRHPSCTTP